MTTIAQLDAPEARDAGRLVAELDIRTHAWIDGKPVEALSGESFPRINPATGVEIAQVAACDAADVDAAVRGARAAFESGVWAHAAPRQRKKVLMPLRRADRGERRRARAARDARHGQADPRRAQRRRSAGSAVHLATTPRPSTRCTTRSRRPDRNAVVHGRARAARRGRGGRAVELPAAHGVVEDRPGARDGQLRRAQAGRAVAALRTPAGGARRRGRPSGRRAPGRPRLRRDRRSRRSAVTTTSTWSTFTGLDRGRQAVPALQRRDQHEARRARVRRQVATSSCLPTPTSTPLRRRIAWGVFYNQGEVLQRRLPRCSCTSDVAGRAARARRHGASSGSSPATRSTRRPRMGAIVDRRSSTACSATSMRASSEGADAAPRRQPRAARRPAASYVEPTIFDARLATT